MNENEPGAGPTPVELGYDGRDLADRTVRAYRDDLVRLHEWYLAPAPAPDGPPPLPLPPQVVATYVSHLDESGARPATIARALAAVADAHRSTGTADPTRDPAVTAAWAVVRAHGTGTDHSLPLVPPMLFDVVGACPTRKTWVSGRRADEPSLGGLRDRALLLTGFAAGLRRSELVGLDVADVLPDPRGLRLRLPDATDGVLLPRGRHASRCPVQALGRWLQQSGIGSGAVFRGVTKANRPGGRALNAESVNALVQQAIARAGYDPAGYSAHSLRAGFVVWSQALGVPDEAIAERTRHASSRGVARYAHLRPRSAADGDG